MRQPDVFISYAWQGESEKIAEEIEQEFCETGSQDRGGFSYGSGRRY